MLSRVPPEKNHATNKIWNQFTQPKHKIKHDDRDVDDL
jgi:hypothetical protein